MFIDKIFAVEFYYIRNMYMDIAKHLYDVTILFNNKDIQKLLSNKNELNKLIGYKRQEEKVRIGGVNEKLLIKDFTYFRLDFDVDLITEFENMQNKYVLNETYKINIEKVKETLNKIYTKLINW